MAKEAYYFSHDSNARYDPKMTAMRSVYGSEGYGWFWILIEMMREADEYKLDMQGKYTFNSYAMQMHTDCNAAERFVHDCIHEFDLFTSDGSYFWSKSLLRRMELREQISEKRRNAANSRWSKPEKNANAQKGDANAMQGKESKRNKSKSNKNIYTAEFEEFWSYYPSGKGKAAAQKAFDKAANSGDDPESMIAGAKKYAIECQKKGTPEDFIAHASTFLNNKRYKDEDKKVLQFQQSMSEEERLRMERERPNERPLINF